MLRKETTTILFDLDGTLLPMSQDAFIKAYFSRLAKKAAEHGYTDTDALVAAVWKGTGAMVKNDGAAPNRRRFWDTFAQVLGEEVRDLEPVFDQFYAGEFDEVKTAVGENPLAKRAVKGLKAKGYQVVLATNPIFPLVGVRTRLSWIGLSPEDFSHVTSYEAYSACKPNLAYYREILEKIGKCPEECLMVGNDAVEDTAAARLGMEVYLVTDCLENADGQGLSASAASKVTRGRFTQFLEFAGV